MTVKNFFSSKCVLQFSAKAVDGVNITLGIRYSIDGGACSVFGPQVFHAPGSFAPNGTVTHTNISVVLFGPGVHTIQPCFVLNDAWTGVVEMRYLAPAVFLWSVELGDWEAV